MLVRFWIRSRNFDLVPSWKDVSPSLPPSSHMPSMLRRNSFEHYQHLGPVFLHNVLYNIHNIRKNRPSATQGGNMEKNLVYFPSVTLIFSLIFSISIPRSVLFGSLGGGGSKWKLYTPVLFIKERIKVHGYPL